MALKKELTKKTKRDELEFESLLPEHKDVYAEIEHLIIAWSLDGTKTAGTLTRRIMKKLAKHKLITIAKDGKKPTNKEIEEKCLENLNGLMKDFGIDSINFGSHSIKKTKGKKAAPLKKTKKKK